MAAITYVYISKEVLHVYYSKMHEKKLKDAYSAS